MDAAISSILQKASRWTVVGLICFITTLSTTALIGWAKHAKGAVSQPESFTIAILPDTQRYSELHPEIFEAQTDWISRNTHKHNILFVAHLGDLVERHYSHHEYQVADRAMAKLDGLVPYSVLAGNHDMSSDGNADTYNHYFGKHRFQQYDWWREGYQSQGQVDPNGNKNNYQIINTPAGKLLFLNLEYCPPTPVLEWANWIAKQHHQHRIILSTHDYLDSKANRSTDCNIYHRQGDNAGQDIWNKLVVKNQNIEMVLNGHILGHPGWTGGSRRTDIINGRMIHQLSSNYQNRPEGGGGYLRLMRFIPEQGKIDVKTYSPYYNNYLTDPANNFSLIWSPARTPLHSLSQANYL